jgi:hypothetical protein
VLQLDISLFPSQCYNFNEPGKSIVYCSTTCMIKFKRIFCVSTFTMYDIVNFSILHVLNNVYFTMWWKWNQCVQIQVVKVIEWLYFIIQLSTCNCKLSDCSKISNTILLSDALFIHCLHLFCWTGQVQFLYL